MKRFIAWLSLKTRLKKFFYREKEGGKARLHYGHVLIVLVPTIGCFVAYSFFHKKEETSFVKQSSKRLGQTGDGPNSAGQTQSTSNETTAQELPKGIKDSSIRSTYAAARARSGGSGGIKYTATQVVQRQGGDPSRKLPIGTSSIGELLTAIDTREQNSFVKVLLPYGASFDHERKIERNSTLFGNVTYPGSGDKVFIKFNRVLFPDGKEFKIEAEALSPLDYSPGLAGEQHDAAGARIGTTLGLTMLSGASDVLVEKEIGGQMMPVATPKSTMKNAFYNGLTKATEQEAHRQAEKIAGEKDYVTVEAGEDVIINLIETFNAEAR